MTTYGIFGHSGYCPVELLPLINAIGDRAGADGRHLDKPRFIAGVSGNVRRIGTHDNQAWETLRQRGGDALGYVLAQSSADRWRFANKCPEVRLRGAGIQGATTQVLHTDRRSSSDAAEPAGLVDELG